jgi:hypothetical protein
MGRANLGANGSPRKTVTKVTQANLHTGPNFKINGLRNNITRTTDIDKRLRNISGSSGKVRRRLVHVVVENDTIQALHAP